MRLHPRVWLPSVMVVALATFGAPGGVSAASPTFRIEPATQTVAAGGTFSVTVVATAETATGGAQATVTFDHTKLQITAVTFGSPYAAAPVLVPTDLAPAIATANTSGSLTQVAAAFLPPDAVAAGDADFLIITFAATACGESPLGLPAGPADAVLLDGTEALYGESVEVTTTEGKVTIPCAEGEVAGVTQAGAAAEGADGGMPVVLPLGLIALAVIVGVVFARRPQRRSTSSTPPAGR